MKHWLHRFGRLLPVVTLVGAVYGSPVIAQSTDQAQAWPPASSVPALQARMKSIREATDPERRMAMMEEQIKALEAASQGAPSGCPMMADQMGAGAMMKGHGQGAGPAPGTGPMGGMMMDPKLMQEHMKMMQQHMSMMENMMKMHSAATPAGPH